MSFFSSFFFPLSCLSIDGFSMQSGMAHPAIGLTLWCPSTAPLPFFSTWSFDVRRNHGWLRQLRSWKGRVVAETSSYWSGKWTINMAIFNTMLNWERVSWFFSWIFVGSVMNFQCFPAKAPSQLVAVFFFLTTVLGRVSPKGKPWHSVGGMLRTSHPWTAVTRRDPCIGRPSLARFRTDDWEPIRCSHWDGGVGP